MRAELNVHLCGGRDTLQTEPSSVFSQGVEADVCLCASPCSPQTIVWSCVPSLQRFRLGVLFPYFLCPPPPASLLLILSSVIVFPPFSPLSSLYLCLVSHQKSHCMGLLALLSLSPFLFSSACPNFGPLCFFLYSFLRYFSIENGLLLFSPSPQSIIFLHALSASLAAVVSNWCFSVSAFILCLFFFFFPFLSSSPSLPLISHLPHSVSAGRDRHQHQTDCLPASAHWTQFCEGFIPSSCSCCHAASLWINQAGSGCETVLLHTRSRYCLTMHFLYNSSTDTADLDLHCFLPCHLIVVVLQCRITEVKIESEEKSCSIVVDY